MKPGPVTVITGATRGLGYALAHELAEGGGHLVTLSRQPTPGLAELAQTHGTMLTEILVDLVDASALEQAAEQMAKVLSKSNDRQCRIIHNAGIVVPIEPADQLLDFQSIRTAFDVNITAPIYLTGHFLAHTRNCPDRRVMLISSGAGRHAYGSWGVYCATKAAMDRYAEVVHAEGHPNLRVCSLAPGVIDTGMQAQIRQTPESKFPAVGRFEDMHRQGMLANAAQTAHATLKLLASNTFGHKLLDDIRDNA
ncbi:MAG: SDR family NAD(P)-dependent oxidoreductase [Burkholderiaceae bacterium]|nr:SDR family NAD(P)-dependent oxidoreductase [Burkholderiaceae bacterium]